MGMRRHWPWSWRPTVSTVLTAGPHVELLSAQERGNVTATHRRLVESLAPEVGSPWSVWALWACLEELRHSTITAAAEIRVHDAWTDGSDGFCVVYTPPFDPDRLVGLRRWQGDTDVHMLYGLHANLYLDRAMSPAYQPGPDNIPDPVAFGVAVAAFDIGEPLGNDVYLLRAAQDGVGWWGSLGPELPSSPHGLITDESAD